ncbi:MAG: hypothetical protein KGJ45_00625 [Elusimicrobia bacterium]|nr:hypothetical protein [Elusimicrobiota bacterium]
MKIPELRDMYREAGGHSGDYQVIVHELLHVAGADNKPAMVHNDPHASREDDLVYACAEAATGNGVERLKACRVCARAP